MIDDAEILEAADAPKSFATLVAAFAADPFMRWMYPTAERYFAHFPGFLTALAGPTFARSAAWRVGDYEAVALWLPPGAASDRDSLIAHLAATLSATQLPEVAAIAATMETHHPSSPHWYLPWLGVDPICQGRGRGGALLRRCLARVDADRLPAFLETANPRNVPFYEAHGFSIVGAAQSASAPPIWFMLRSAR